MQHTRPVTHDPVLLAAVETCEAAWALLWQSLVEEAHVTVQRAYINEWCEADDRVKRLVKERNDAGNHDHKQAG